MYYILILILKILFNTSKVQAGLNIFIGHSLKQVK